MSIAKRFNKGRLFKYTIPEGHPYISLCDMYNNNGEDHIYIVRMLYINKKSRYGDEGVVVIDDGIVNLPNHLAETIKEIMSDEEAVDAINEGKLGFQIYTYIPRNREETCFSIEWVDIE